MSRDAHERELFRRAFRAPGPELQRQHEEDWPRTPGQLERCDFCGVLLPPEQLVLAPCADFTTRTIVAARVGYVACECHGLKGTPPGQVSPMRHEYRGGWVACPSCREDIDRDWWPAVARRAQRHDPPQQGVMSASEERTLREGIWALFRLHRLPGGWQPFGT